MDSNLEPCENPESKSSTEEEQQLEIFSSQFPFATFSLSFPCLPTALPTHHFFIQPKTQSLFKPPNKAKIPTQASSLSHLSFSSISPSPSKISFKSTISNNPLQLQSTLSLSPRRPLDPSNGAAIRRASIVWFRNDLRVHDNESLNTANNESMSVLPVYCFDLRDYGKSSSGFDKTGPYRATFMLESVSDLRNNLQARGSDLVVRIGNPESVLLELAKAIGADAIYAQREVSNDEVKAEERVDRALKEEGVEVKYFWGSTLFHVDDLPFKLDDMPSNYGGFREKVKGLEIRKTIEALDQMKSMPSTGDVEAGDIPSLTDLGINQMAQDCRPSVSASMVGGESEALQRLKKFAAECQAQLNKGSKDGSQDSTFGANFSCKISPWLAMGCLSPRSMFDKLKKTTTRSISAALKKKEGDTGINWLMHELLWRDFFRFITKKYSCAKVGAAPVTACTGSLA